MVLPYGRQNIDNKDIEEVVKVLKSDYLTTGPTIEKFEKKFAQYVNAKYAIAVSNGTAALHIACIAANLTNGDELITSPMTFAASSNCALYCNANPVFVDVNKHGLIDEKKIEEKITPKTKIIIPVHYSGLPCNLDEIKKITENKNLIVIEDACHALGATYKNSKIGDCKYSDMSIFSFHPVKHITTGEGGMITTNSFDLYEKLLMLRTHGITKNPKYLTHNEGPWFYQMHYLGYNYRMTDIQAALGLSQLSKINLFVERRIEIAKMYMDAFKGNEFIEFIPEFPDRQSSYHLFPILIKNEIYRKEIFEKLQKNGLGVQVHYIPVYKHPVYQKLGYPKELYSNTEQFYKKEISIPMYPSMMDSDIKKVIDIIIDIVQW